MREIKFRAWKGTQMLTFEEMRDGDCDAWPTLYFALTSDEYIPMQFTGLKDSKNREIYEGDILRITDTLTPVPNTYLHVVSDKLGWCTDGEGEYRGASKDYAVFGWDLALPYEGHHEVIGNIYENPELLT